MVKNTFIVVLSLLLLNSCSESSRETLAKVDIKKGAACIPEATLMAKGIIGGKLVNPTDKDSASVAMVVSEYEDKKDGKTEIHMDICTATLIGPKTLLTAAHCIKTGLDKTFVIFYTALSCESGFDGTKNSQRVSKISVHEDYVPSKSDKGGSNDIALITLQEPAPLNYPVYKIANPTDIKDSKLYFYGYGVIGSNAGGSGILRKTSFSKEEFFVEIENKKIRVNQDHGTGICFGDSGGPSFVNIEGEAQILGVTSFVSGPDTDRCSQTSTLTLAYSYKEWIQDAMKKNR